MISEYTHNILKSRVKFLEKELHAITLEAETNQKWAFLEWRAKAEGLAEELADSQAECNALEKEKFALIARLAKVEKILEVTGFGKILGTYGTVTKWPNL
jgi:uncharacterized protein YciW